MKEKGVQPPRMPPNEFGGGMVGAFEMLKGRKKRRIVKEKEVIVWE